MGLTPLQKDFDSYFLGSSFLLILMTGVQHIEFDFIFVYLSVETQLFPS